MTELKMSDEILSYDNKILTLKWPGNFFLKN